jgi:peroxiredoxin
VSCSADDASAILRVCPVKTTLLYFMRAASCAQCNQHTKQLEKLLPRLESHTIGVIVIVPGGSKESETVRTRNNLTMPVMSSNSQTYAEVGLDRKLHGLVQQSGTVLVDPTGNILYKKIATNPTQSFDESETLASIEAL